MEGTLQRAEARGWRGQGGLGGKDEPGCPGPRLGARRGVEHGAQKAFPPKGACITPLESQHQVLAA